MAGSVAETVVKQLRHTQVSVSDLIEDMTYTKLIAKGDDGWSAMDYFKHLIMSVKPVVKAGSLPRETLIKSFGASGRASRPYEQIVAMYDKRLKEGIRAEDAPAMNPANYRLPAGTKDDTAYLLKDWATTHTALYKIIEAFKPIDLDMIQLPHPAIGLITFHEMIHFTLYHNTMHWHDINELMR